MPRKTRTTPPRRPPALPVLASQVHPPAMTTAPGLAGGDIRRQPAGARTVVVLNFRGQTLARRTGRRS